jgi:hypothetical protein
MPIASITKPKPPQGLAYVLKTSQLETALATAAIDCHVDLQYWSPQGSRSVLQVQYWLPNARVDYPRLYVRAGTVPQAFRAVAVAGLSPVWPQFVAWLQGVWALPENSPKLHEAPFFHAYYEADRLQISQYPERR